MAVYLITITFSGYIKLVLSQQEVISAFLEVSFYVYMLLFTVSHMKETVTGKARIIKHICGLFIVMYLPYTVMSIDIQL